MAGPVGGEISLFAALYPGDVWLNQANHIFRRLCVVSDFEDYVYLDSIKFRLSVSEATEHPPPGFLFPASHIGLSIHPGRIVSVLRMQQASDFLHLSSVLQLLAALGTPASMKDCDNFTKQKALIHTAKMLPSIWIIRSISYPLKLRLLFAHVDGERFGVDLDSTRASYESEYLHLSAPENSDSFTQSSRNVEDDMPPPSPAFKFLMNVQLALILFLALCWTYNHVSLVLH
ncbi:hypothetical protein MSAN_02131600 [Mycena sanguinolenta]|uniref:Uncharacterized protein n=1 Tax=Mycena sanguinolenta TaxID=230812 RepID=A0A8H7CLM0_9AGAR|nr:hypothetical protein MSAN_02131600 [Mycena sanguinolenta]